MYIDNLKTASYESPSGAEISFDFEAVSRDIPLRIGSFEFSGVNGTLHQDKGRGGELYPLTVFIHGPDYDLEADKFTQMSKEIGNGFLNHPRWGRKRVQMLSFSQNENLTKSAGQAVFNVTWQETLEREFPKTGIASQQQVKNLADAAQTDAMNNFADQASTETLSDELSFKQKMIAGATKVKDTLSSVTSADQGIAATFRSHIDNIFNNVNDYIEIPFDFAFEITSAIRVIAEIPGRISSRIQGFTNLLDILKLSEITTPSTSEKNSILIDEIVGTTAMTTVSESINSALAETSTIARDSKGKATINAAGADSGFQTRGEVLSAVVYLQNNSESLIEFLDEVQIVFEDNILSKSYIQTVQSYVPTRQVVSAVIKSGLELSFSLPVKRTHILITDRTILDLCYEFYKNIDDATLDYSIQTNCLTENDIIAVPRGREFVYYE